MSDRDYISKQGYQSLQDELEHLFRVERPRVVANVSAAAAEGDRSENAEYIYGKKRLREIDRRIEFLTKRVDLLQVVEPSSECEVIRFLSTVTVSDEAGNERTFRIVGADETNTKRGWISWKSPVGRALIGKRLDDVVAVKTPSGLIEYCVEAIAVVVT
jgi:transcription elongation factor GreB